MTGCSGSLRFAGPSPAAREARKTLETKDALRHEGQREIEGAV